MSCIVYDVNEYAVDEYAVAGQHGGVPSAKPTPELVHLGERIRALRLKTGLSQEALAAAAGIHRTYMSALERGIYNPTYTTLVKLARALRVRPGKLFDE